MVGRPLSLENPLLSNVRLRHLLALLLLCGAMPALAAHRVIVFVWDGMRPDAISTEDTPNLAALVQRGSFFANNHATYPTFTMVNASSFATGAYPGTIGFYGNRFWAPDAQGKDAHGVPVDFRAPAFMEDYAILQDLDRRHDHALLGVPTLLAVAQKKGLVTAAVGKSGPAFLQDYRVGGVVLDENVALPMSFARDLQHAGFALPANTVHADADSPLVLEPDNDSPTAQAPVVKLKDGVTSDPTDATGTPPAASNAYLMRAFLEYVLPVRKPDLSIVWLRNPDITEHYYGVGTPNFHLALQAQDALLGQLLDTLKALGMDKDTNVLVVSDHGHSNVGGARDLYPLRSINDGKVAGVDETWGFSVSGGVRLADVLTRGGFQAFDGSGCVYSPVMSGTRRNGSAVHPTKFDDDGRLCGKPGPYTTPSYRIPDPVPRGALVLAPNGGSEYLYQPEHDAALVARTVRFLQSQEPIGAIFVDGRYGKLPGTLPMATVHLTGRASPDIVVSYDFDADAMVQGFRGTEYDSMSIERGMHGSFSPIDVHNTFLATGPDFRRGFRDELPSGNVDLAPTLAAVLGLSLPRADGRPLREALTGDHAVARDTYTASRSDIATPEATGLSMSRADGSASAATHYRFVLHLQHVDVDGKRYTYFDSAKAERH